MNRDDIIRMAREVGMQGMLTDVVTTLNELERFARLVAAAAKAEEREACKKACIELKQIGAEAMFGPYWDRACVDCANAIDARGDK